MCKAQCCGMSGMLSGRSSLPKGVAGSLALRSITYQYAQPSTKSAGRSSHCRDLPPLGPCRALLATPCCVRRCMLAYQRAPMSCCYNFGLVLLPWAPFATSPEPHRESSARQHDALYLSASLG